MDCIFCEIVKGSVPSEKVYENEQVLAFRDIQPAAPVHILIIPKKHIASLSDVPEGDWGIVAEIQKAARHIASELGLEESGYRVLTNSGKDAGQVVFHLHYHLLGGEALGPLNAK